MHQLQFVPVDLRPVNCATTGEGARTGASPRSTLALAGLEIRRRGADYLLKIHWSKSVLNGNVLRTRFANSSTVV